VCTRACGHPTSSSSKQPVRHPCLRCGGCRPGPADGAPAAIKHKPHNLSLAQYISTLTHAHCQCHDLQESLEAHQQQQRGRGVSTLKNYLLLHSRSTTSINTTTLPARLSHLEPRRPTTATVNSWIGRATKLHFYCGKTHRKPTCGNILRLTIPPPDSPSMSDRSSSSQSNNANDNEGLDLIAPNLHLQVYFPKCKSTESIHWEQVQDGLLPLPPTPSLSTVKTWRGRTVSRNFLNPKTGTSTAYYGVITHIGIPTTPAGSGEPYADTHKVNGSRFHIFYEQDQDSEIVPWETVHNTLLPITAKKTYADNDLIRIIQSIPESPDNWFTSNNYVPLLPPPSSMVSDHILESSLQLDAESSHPDDSNPSPDQADQSQPLPLALLTPYTLTQIGPDLQHVVTTRKNQGRLLQRCLYNHSLSRATYSYPTTHRDLPLSTGEHYVLYQGQNYKIQLLLSQEQKASTQTLALDFLQWSLLPQPGEDPPPDIRLTLPEVMLLITPPPFPVREESIQEPSSPINNTDPMFTNDAPSPTPAALRPTPPPHSPIAESQDSDINFDHIWEIQAKLAHIDYQRTPPWLCPSPPPIQRQSSYTESSLQQETNTPPIPPLDAPQHTPSPHSPTAESQDSDINSDHIWEPQLGHHDSQSTPLWLSQSPPPTQRQSSSTEINLQQEANTPPFQPLDATHHTPPPHSPTEESQDSEMNCDHIRWELQAEIAHLDDQSTTPPWLYTPPPPIQHSSSSASPSSPRSDISNPRNQEIQQQLRVHLQQQHPTPTLPGTRPEPEPD
jgi:hypothetical protein